MLASVIDSFLDLLSGAVLFVTRRAMDRTDIYLYPQGKRRLEPVGVVVFATVMAISALQIVREAAQRYAGGRGRELCMGAWGGKLGREGSCASTGVKTWMEALMFSVFVDAVPWWVGSVVEGLMGKPHVIDVDWTVLIVVFVTVGSKFFMCIFCKIVAEVMWAQLSMRKDWCVGLGVACSRCFRLSGVMLYILRQYSGLSSSWFALTIQRTGSGSVAAYAADHGNDVISNLVGIAGT